jgi:hypothetical protein
VSLDQAELAQIGLGFDQSFVTRWFTFAEHPIVLLGPQFEMRVPRFGVAVAPPYFGGE